MRHTKEVDPVETGELPSCPIDARIAALSEGQFGVVSRDQIIGLGLSTSAIDWRIDVGRLHMLHRGVYAVGDRALPPRGRLMAALLASGSEAVASHRSAAEVHGLRAYAGIPEITTPPGSKQRKGMRRRSATLQEDEVTVVQGVRVTTVARTLLDLGAIDKALVDKCVREADYLGLFDLDEVVRLLDRYPRRCGTAHLRRALATFVESENRTRSDMEERFRSLVLDANLPRPDLNGTVELGERTIEADAVWRGAKLLIELDGRQAHVTRHAFEADRERDRAAALHGWLVLRVTWRMLIREHRRLLSDIRALLKARTRS